MSRLSRSQCAILKTEGTFPPRSTLGSLPIEPSHGYVVPAAYIRIGKEPPTAAVPAAISMPLMKSRRLMPALESLAFSSSRMLLLVGTALGCFTNLRSEAFRNNGARNATNKTTLLKPRKLRETWVGCQEKTSLTKTSKMRQILG